MHGLQLLLLVLIVLLIYFHEFLYFVSKDVVLGRSIDALFLMEIKIQ